VAIEKLGAELQTQQLQYRIEIDLWYDRKKEQIEGKRLL
jgi:hypothetical protein